MLSFRWMTCGMISTREEPPPHSTLIWRYEKELYYAIINVSKNTECRISKVRAFGALTFWWNMTCIFWRRQKFKRPVRQFALFLWKASFAFRYISQHNDHRVYNHYTMTVWSRSLVAQVDASRHSSSSSLLTSSINGATNTGATDKYNRSNSRWEQDDSTGRVGSRFYYAAVR